MSNLRQENLERYAGMVRGILIEVASNMNVITYGQLHDRLGGRPGRGYLGQVLEKVSFNEDQKGLPLLSALVVKAGKTQKPGSGFWSMGFLPPSIKSGSDSVKDYFWQTCVNECWDKYAPR
jgi:hypothetical protein